METVTTKMQPSIFKGVIEMKHLCWSCGIWRTCKNVKDGPAKFCDRWKRRTYREILKSCGVVFSSKKKKEEGLAGTK